jgi:XTP/dITP diphosphohydrolase
MKLVLATDNPGKLRELSTLLPPRAIQVLPQSAFGLRSAEETGATFVDNALLKARHAARATGLPAIADDSGLEVDALDGRPGVHSARYAGPQAGDEQNNARLLEELRDIPPERRTARYRCVLAMVRSPDDSTPVVCEGVWEGRIGQAPRGQGGFGYDPLFEVDSSGRTAAELPPEEKNRLSHRGQALRLLAANWPPAENPCSAPCSTDSSTDI